MQIGYRKKIVVDANHSVAKQIGKVQRGQWLWIYGMNARVLNILKNGIIVVQRFDRKTRCNEILQYA